MRRRALALASGVLLALLVGAAWWMPDAVPPVRESSGVPGAVGASAVPVSSAPHASAPDAAAAPASWTFTTRLLPDGAIGARHDGVRIGLAYVAPEDARRHAAWILDDAAGVGADSLAELAQVVRWIDAPATALADGVLQVGPIGLPAADRYELQALGDDPLHFYMAGFTRAQAPASIEPLVAAGLRLRRTPDSRGDARVLLRRDAAADVDPRWQALLQREAPELLDAYSERALPLSAVEATLLVPLPPTPIELVLEVGGIEAERRALALASGRVVEVEFDPVAQAVAASVALRLELEFVLEGSETPLEALQVTLHGSRAEASARTDRLGEVAFDAVDRQRTQRISVAFPASREPLPRWPTTQALELELDPRVLDPATREVRQRVALTALQWLVVRTGAATLPFQREAGRPYPVFVLQRERDGRWIDGAAEFFVPVPEGIAVSVQGEGRVRLKALLTPWTVLESAAVDIAAHGHEGRHEVELISDPGHPVELTLLRDALPMAQAPVALIGNARGLPPWETSSDASGRLRLERVTVDSVRLEVPGFLQQRVDLRAAVAQASLRRDPQARAE
jgi:hypothetical protein